MLNFSKNDKELYCLEIKNLITKLNKYKSLQFKYKLIDPTILNSLTEQSFIDSLYFVNKFEKREVSTDRIKLLITDFKLARTIQEEQIIGYIDLLRYVQSTYESIDITSSMILLLHKDLYKYNQPNFSGNWKNTNNFIKVFDKSKNDFIVINCLDSDSTDKYINTLCSEYTNAYNENDLNPILLIAKFILNFTYYRPFNKGNESITHLLITLILFKADYNIGKYISLSRIINKKKNEYYYSIINSQTSYKPFVIFIINVLIEAYETFNTKVKALNNSYSDETEKIKSVFDVKLMKFSKQDINNKFPEISKYIIEKVLDILVKENFIIKTRDGRNIKYISRK